MEIVDYLMIGATIRIGWEILCLPYAGFFLSALLGNTVYLLIKFVKLVKAIRTNAGLTWNHQFNNKVIFAMAFDFALNLDFAKIIDYAKECNYCSSSMGYTLNSSIVTSNNKHIFKLRSYGGGY